MGAGHSHHHDRSSSGRLALTLVLVAAYMVAEIVGGILTNSLALLADAAHMFSDMAALALALFAAWFSKRPGTARHTYGYYRTEILAALANGAILLAVSLHVVKEAWHRLGAPQDVQGGPMMAIAAGGLVVNVASLWVLHGGREDSLNLRAAWLHVLSDALGSVQVLIAGALILGFGWTWADPVASALVALLVLRSAWALLGEAAAVLMERAPRHIDVDDVREAILATSGVAGVHDLHVWTITSGLDALSAHVEMDDGHSQQVLLQDVRDVLHDRFGIDHLTIQLEPSDFTERGTAC